jgi:excisionase family DNA binding protein
MSAKYVENTGSPSGMLTVSEAARLLHVHPNTIRQWSDSGLLKAYRLGYRRDRRFRLEDIYKLIASYHH